MKNRNDSYPLRGVSRKVQAALALAVSLWIANGAFWAPGVASAEVTITSTADAEARVGTDVNRGALGNPLYYPKNGSEMKIAGGDCTVANFAAGFQEGYVEVSGCTLTVDSGTFNGTLAGGRIHNLLASGTVMCKGNTVYFNGGSGAQLIYGGYVDNGVAWDNTVLMSGGTTNGITGGSTMYGTAIGNTVTISGGTVNALYSVSGGYSEDGAVIGNTVTISGGTVNYVYGGRSEYGAATGNTVTISGGTVNRVRGGYSKKGMATGNTVTISGGTANDVCGGYSEKSAATGNTVTIIGSATVNGDVYSGYSDTGTTTNNIIRLINATVQSDVYGGNKGSDGNTLNLWGSNTVHAVKNFEAINITGATWGTPVLTMSGPGLKDNSDGSKAVLRTVTFFRPESVVSGKTTPLITATASMSMEFTEDTTQTYALHPVAGVTIDAALQGRLAFTDGKKVLNYTAIANSATKLTFNKVGWKNEGALLDHSASLANLSFNGAEVDTSNIWFTSGKYIAGNRKMTLVKDFGETVGTVTGTKFKAGTTLEGTGKASLVGNDLVFEVGTKPDGTPDIKPQEQTHNSLMGAGAGMATLSVGNDFIGDATDGLGLASNVGTDGVSCYANFGGGAMRQETGSHIDVKTWNAILALGRENKKERGTMKYGAFFEYGTGNYTTYNGDLRGDGSTRYTGGGLLAKWTAKGGAYVEGSFRAGSVHGETKSIMLDENDDPYNCDVDAPYLGAHLGVGKEIALKNGDTVDVYGKYFMNRRNSTSFDMGGHYELDALTSQILRVGARYTMKRENWDFYGGLAYEHEFDGKASGTADGYAIRGTDPTGGSARLELGATMQADKKSPWSLDLNLAGFVGKKRGVSGGVSVAFMF